ncbi:MAG: hypothetical protein LBV55_03815 [Acholeplasmatales bacterium]|jgi:hypothetical protein|nr:hypothetical protein [Acholeplasmatales bacterium]
MEKLIDKKRKYLRICLLGTSVFIIGIAALIVGLVVSLLYVWIPGVVIVVGGFYLVPIAWVMYPKYDQKIGIARNITQGILSYDQLARNAHLKIKAIIPIITNLLVQYLVEYSVNETNDGLVLSADIVKNATDHYCRFCGGKLDSHEKRCSLCGGVVTKS